MHLKNFISKETFKNLGTLMGGTALAGIMPIIAAPIIARLYSPEFYGIFGLFTTISTLIGIIAYSHYPQSIMIVKENNSAKQAVWFSLFLTAAVSLLTLLIILILYTYISDYANGVLRFWFFFIPLAVFLAGVNNVLNTWANRIKHYRRLAYNRIIQSFLTLFTQIIFGIYFKTELGIMLGFFVGQIVGIILLWIDFTSKENDVNIGKPNLIECKNIAIDFRKLAVLSVPIEMLNNLANQAPVFLLQKYGGSVAVGNYSYATKFLTLPIQFISNSFGDLFKQKSGQAYHETGDARSLFFKTFKVLFLLGLIPYFVLGFFSPQLFAFFFGDKWLNAGAFASALSVLYFLKFVVSPLTFTIFLAKKFTLDLIITIGLFISTSLALYIGLMFFPNSIMPIWLFSFVYSLNYIFTFFISLYYTKKPNNV
jgi:O-antigen/teichoic acid export membrane protein